MPTYDYQCRCDKCGNKTTITVRNREEVPTCSKCGCDMRRLAVAASGKAPGFELKPGGVGWARQGYAGRGK